MLRLKAAVTDRAVLMVTVQVPVPEQPSPLQPVNVDPVEAEAVSVTIVLYGYDSEQSDPQLMPAGSLVTVPLPVPVLIAESIWLPGALKVAVTFLAAFIVTVQDPVPEQPSPFQPPNVEGAVAVGVKVTVVL